MPLFNLPLVPRLICVSFVIDDQEPFLLTLSVDDAINPKAAFPDTVVWATAADKPKPAKEPIIAVDRRSLFVICFPFLVVWSNRH